VKKPLEQKVELHTLDHADGFPAEQVLVLAFQLTQDHPLTAVLHAEHAQPTQVNDHELHPAAKELH
jgi:5-hydroxyisourate hydrolase-like protein (transthyretin family)